MMRQRAMPQGWSHIAPLNLWGWLLVGCAAVSLVVIGLLVVLILRQREALARPRMTPAQERALERDIRGLVNELAEMSRQVGAELDARAIRLEELIRDADDRLMQLEQARDAAPVVIEQLRDPAPSPLPAHPAIAPSNAPAATAPSNDGPDPRHVEIYTLADQGMALQEIAARLRRPKGEVELIIALRPDVARATRP
jgi:hypothetical protein